MAAKMGCFTLTWEIKNFNVLQSKANFRSMVSPDFKTMTSEGNVWRSVIIYDLGHHLKFKYSTKNGESIERFEVSLIASGRKIPVPSETHFTILKSALGSNSRFLLHDDTLTVCCKMWKVTMQTGEVRIRTVLHSYNFFWNIENFNAYRSYSNYKSIERDGWLFNMTLDKSDDNRTHNFQVETLHNIYGYLSFVYFKPSINVMRGRIAQPISLSQSTQRWHFEIFARNNTARNLKIDMEAIYAIHVELQDQLSNSPVCARKAIVIEDGILSSGSLKDDLLNLYRDALHSDATLKTGGKSFPAHKGILSTRSEVFRAMFERDHMKEGQEGVVVIDDLDSETVERMLVFLYGDTLGDVSWEEASALYYAADKYAILPLKRKCIDILKAGLTANNACDAIVLADKHSDQDLMDSTVEYILSHKEVISCSEWEKLEETHSRLTSKIMKQILLKKWVN